jgi:hypothetical protein
MPCVGFEPTILVFDRAKTVGSLNRPATLIGVRMFTNFSSKCYSLNKQPILFQVDTGISEYLQLLCIYQLRTFAKNLGYVNNLQCSDLST